VTPVNEGGMRGTQAKLQKNPTELFRKNIIAKKKFGAILTGLLSAAIPWPTG